MEKLYWLILLSPMVGDKSHPIGEKMQFSSTEYLELIARGTAKPKNKKEHEQLKAEHEEALAAQEELKVKAIASLKQEDLKESALLLKEELESTLELISDDEFVLDTTAKLKAHIDHHHQIFNNVMNDIREMTSEELKDKYKEWEAPTLKEESKDESEK